MLPLTVILNSFQHLLLHPKPSPLSTKPQTHKSNHLSGPAPWAVVVKFTHYCKEGLAAHQRLLFLCITARAPTRCSKKPPALVRLNRPTYRKP
jgi:hypothetical protein